MDKSLRMPYFPLVTCQIAHHFRIWKNPRSIAAEYIGSHKTTRSSIHARLSALSSSYDLVQTPRQRPKPLVQLILIYGNDEAGRSPLVHSILRQRQLIIPVLPLD
jgi:hypothetical protein